MRRSDRRARRVRLVAATLALALLAAGLLAAVSATAEAAAPFEVAAAGTAGELRAPYGAAEPCDTAAGRVFTGGAPVTAGGLRAGGRTDLAVQLDVVRAAGGRAYLRPAGSAVTLTNGRGAVRLLLSAGTCAAPGLTESGTWLTGEGTWTLDPVPAADGSESYRGATGSGTFTIEAGLRAGTSNAWSVRLSGDLGVLQPAVEARLVRSYWSHAGVDYAGRLATAVYELTNTGTGDAFGVAVTGATGPAGVVPLHWTGEDAGALRPGETVRLLVRWRVKGAPGSGPVLTGRQFVAGLDVVAHDARDAAVRAVLAVPTVTPAFPPAL